MPFGDGVRLGIQGLQGLTDQFQSIHKERREDAAALAKEQQGAQGLASLAADIRQNPQFYKADSPQHAEVMANFVEHVGSSNLGKVLDVLGPEILNPKEPGSTDAALMEAIRLKARGEMFQDPQQVDQANKIISTVIDTATSLLSSKKRMQLQVEQEFKGTDVGGGGGRKGGGRRGGGGGDSLAGDIGKGLTRLAKENLRLDEAKRQLDNPKLSDKQRGQLQTIIRTSETTIRAEEAKAQISTQRGGGAAAPGDQIRKDLVDGLTNGF